MTIHVDADRLIRSRFALSRLAELNCGLEVLAHPERAPYAHSWVQHTRRRLDPAGIAVLLALVEHGFWYIPDFLVPMPLHWEPSLEEELAALAATAASRVSYELRITFRIGDPPPESMRRVAAGRRADPRVTLPDVLRAVLDSGGEEALIDRVIGELRYCWRQTLAESWPLLRRVLDEDVRYRAVVAVRSGLTHLLTELDPRITWADDRLLLDSPAESSVDAQQGLILTPSVFLHRPAIWRGGLGEVLLGYPARGRGQVWAGPGLIEGSAKVLGARRTAILADLRIARTTTELAARHRLSPATVSYHLTRLYEAGLVERRRSGQSVRYERTALAADLLAAGEHRTR